MFEYYNPHPKGLTGVGDCVKRAICLASGIDYHDVAIMLNRFRKVSKTTVYNDNKNWKMFVEQVMLGEKIEEDMRYINCGYRYTVEDFSESIYNQGGDVYILRTAKHLVATNGFGSFLDTWDSGWKSVYIAYKIPSRAIIINNLRKRYAWLCQGLELGHIKPSAKSKM